MHQCLGRSIVKACNETLSHALRPTINGPLHFLRFCTELSVREGDSSDPARAAARSERLHAPLERGTCMQCRSRRWPDGAENDPPRLTTHHNRPCCLTAAPYNSSGPRLTRLVPAARRLQTRNRDMCAKTRRRAYTRRTSLRAYAHCTACVYRTRSHQIAADAYSFVL